jgi:small nuclear ribonucleoprotein F
MEPVNPAPFLQGLVGERVIVKLKWGGEYHALLVSTDAFMNLQLTNCVEYMGGKACGNLQEVLIRCNNVLHIRAAPEEEGEEGMD